MSTFVQTVISGVLSGGVYGLVAVGLTLIYGVMRIVNFAHGEFLMVGMYISFLFYNYFGINPYLSAVLSFISMFILGAVIQDKMLYRIYTAPNMNKTLLTVGLSLFLSNIVCVIFSGDNRTINTGISSATIKLGEIVISEPRLIAFAAATVATLGIGIFLQKSRLGKGIRAAAQNRDAAMLMGVNVRKVFALAFGLGAGTAAVAGSLISPFFYISPTSGQTYSTTANVIVVLGTLGNFKGAFIAALLIGIAESLCGVYLQASLKQLATFIIFIVVLLFKPEGLFGGKKG